MRLRATGAIAAGACVALLAGAGGASAATAHLKDCGGLTSNGFGGAPPAGVPAGARPSLRAFRVAGHLGCATVHSVMQKFENNAGSTLTLNKPPVPGWSCKFSTHARGYVCRKGANVIEEQIVWTLAGKRVGPRPKGP